MAQREAQRRRADGHAVGGADIPDAPGPRQHLGRGGGVVVVRAVSRVGQDAAVEHAAREHLHAAVGAQRQQLGGGGRVEQRVASGHEHAVQVRPGDEPGQRRRGVHPDADRADHAGRAEPGQRRVGRIQRLRHEVVRVVDERDVHPVQPEPPQAVFQAPAHPVRAVVAHPGQRRGAVELVDALYRA